MMIRCGNLFAVRRARTNPMIQDLALAAANPSEWTADHASIDAILAAFYDIISGPAGVPRDWARAQALFVPGARLIAGAPAMDGEVSFEIFDPESYAASRAPYFAAHSFYECEVARRTECHGRIAQVFSTYESRTDPSAPPFLRGVNALQLLHTEGRWWIVSVTWQHETPGPIATRGHR
jgi:hypothetical protein